jgi:hypothetical protein
MELEAAFDDGGGDGGVRLQIVHLGEDVLAGELHDLLGVGLPFTDFVDNGAGAGTVLEPLGDVGEFGDPLRVEEAVHNAAIGVAADDDVFDFEDADGVFNGRRNAAVVIAVSGDDVAGVTADEKLAGAGLHEHVGDDAAVGTSDEKAARLLAARETTKIFFMGGVYFLTELFIPGDEFTHRDS